ncbi:Alpha/Beta hydrolase protein [Gymnopilus junonius]|uniref:Alpha/Beta hydrolase protein n=1 Tax=Gymnopilus junonius TaxID=109634 RepID=A0A9P5NUI8_GYMJU|nr:Alpha/Beta hydrolase protein [Gymnopilus junonius]
MAAPSVEKLLKSTDGIDIFARAVGDHTKPSLVFVHGLALSGYVFDGLFKEDYLLDRFYLVSYDMRGHGRSGKPDTVEGYASTLYADDFAAVVNANLATVACDVCANLESGSISGIVYAAGLPYMGPVMNEVGKPLILGFLPGLFSTDDVLLSIHTKIAFIDSIFNNPDGVPVGLNVQDPVVCKALLSRTQDPGKLFQAGSDGLPLMMISGTKDTHIHTIEGGSHAMFYDNTEVFVKAVAEFATRVTRNSRP